MAALSIVSMRLLKTVVTVGVLLSCLPRAHAHISVEMGGTHKARNADAGLKEAPCGIAGSPRGMNVHTYKPGATVNIKILETTIHPGYFRVSFDNDGDDGFVIPKGTDGALGNCNGDPACGAGKQDFCSNETVLLDNIEPHGGSFLDPNDISYTFSVTLPNVECANCTLQIIQVMNDFNVHPQPYPADDIYYQCIDLVLSNSAPDVPDMPMPNKAMNCKEGGTMAPTMAGAAGAAAPATPAAAGAAAPATPAAAGSGAPMSAAPATPTGGARATTPTTPAAMTSPSRTTTPPATSSGAAGSVSMPVGMTTQPAMAAAPAAEESGGCNTAGNRGTGLFAPAFLLVAWLWRRRRLA